MCKLKSGIILKDRIFMPDYDSHTDMLEELNIDDTRENASRLFVRAELYPKNGDVFSNIDDWEFNVDQDILPEWFVEKYEKSRMVGAVKDWAKTHIHIGIDNLTIKDGKNHYIKDCHNVNICDSATVKNICGSATVEYICDSATVKNICGSATVEYICDSATVEYICGSATVEYICGSATVEYICDSATVKNIYGSATVEYICDSATVEYICDSATVKNICDSATVEYIYGSATVEYICDSATVKNICDSATVEYIYGSATVKNIYGSATVEYGKGNAIIITSKVSKWHNLTSTILLENSTIKDNYGKVVYQSGDVKLIHVTNGKITEV